MTRDGRETQDQLARLGDQVSPPSEDEFREMARTASSRSRPLPRAAPTRRWPLRARWTGVLAVALVVAVAAGVGLGALIAPSGTAAPGPIGTGFLPGPGWTVLQTGEDATLERQALAVATNVRLHPEDDARGIRGSSGLPYSTLLELPARGVVVVALFTRPEFEPPNDDLFPERDLPLRIRDAFSAISYGYQLRPDRPLGQYELRATVGGHRVTLHFYFGTRNPSPQLIASTQQQLDRLVVASASAAKADRAPAAVAQPDAARVVDRTLACSMAPGNPPEITVSATSGTRLFEDRSKWKFRASASFMDQRTAFIVQGPGWVYGTGASAWVTAGWPPLDAESLTHASPSCRPSSARVPLSTKRLSGGVASPTEDRYDCVVPKRILVRVRGVFRAPTSLRPTRRSGERQWSARGAVIEGALAIQAADGRPIAYATVAASGRARLFVGDGCGPSR